MYLLFSNRKIVSNIPNLQLSGENISRKEKTKFLGLLIDDKLSWKPHSQCVLSKMNRAIGIMFKTRDFLTPSALRMIYFSLVFPYMFYAIIFWGGVCEQQLEKKYTKPRKNVSELLPIQHILPIQNPYPKN